MLLLLLTITLLFALILFRVDRKCHNSVSISGLPPISRMSKLSKRSSVRPVPNGKHKKSNLIDCTVPPTEDLPPENIATKEQQDCSVCFSNCVTDPMWTLNQRDCAELCKSPNC